MPRATCPRFRMPTLVLALAGLMAVGCSDSRPAATPRDVAATPAAKADPKPRRLIFITNGDDPFWDACLSGLKEGEKRFGCAAAGLTVARDVNNGTAEGQIERLRQYATQDDVAGVAISVIQADNQSIIDEMKRLFPLVVQTILLVDSNMPERHQSS